jgi:hypothetical protein
MGMIYPGGFQGGPYSGGGGSSPTTLTGKIVNVVVSLLAIPVFIVVAPAAFGIALALLQGSLLGIGVGFGAIGHVLAGTLVSAPASAAILGALSGAIAAWLDRARKIRSELGHSFISSLLSPEMFAPDFVCRLIVSTFVGWTVASAFASIGLVGVAAGDLHGLVDIVTGGGGGGPNPGEPISVIYWLLVLLAALLAAGAVVGGFASGFVGTIVGVGISTVGFAPIAQGAAEGLVYRFFLGFRSSEEKPNRFVYAVTGTFVGIGQGLVAGAGSGIVLFVARAVGVLS